MFINLEEIEKKENEAKTFIQNLQEKDANLQTNELEKDFVILAQWLLTTKSKNIFEPAWNKSVNNTIGIYNLLSNLHYAMVDDGEISVCTIKTNFKEETLIFFSSPFDFNRYDEFKKYICKSYNNYSECLKLTPKDISMVKTLGTNFSSSDFIKIKMEEMKQKAHEDLVIEVFLADRSIEDATRVIQNKYPEIVVESSWLDDFNKNQRIIDKKMLDN